MADGSQAIRTQEKGQRSSLGETSRLNSLFGEQKAHACVIAWLRQVTGRLMFTLREKRHQRPAFVVYSIVQFLPHLQRSHTTLRWPFLMPSSRFRDSLRMTTGGAESGPAPLDPLLSVCAIATLPRRFGKEGS